jgi:adenosylcobinamide-phosphate synthase
MISFFIHPFVFVAVEAILVWLGLAQTSLRKESMKVHDAFAKNDTEKARNAVSMIVGRDTKNLTAEGIMRAAVETVAENTSDGVTAPLIYCALFGSAGEYVYKAVNTMDSMIGYKNERYIDFGKCAARLDDILNFIPSRISAVLMICASFLLRMDYKNAAKIFKRDRLKHASPNSAQTESVCAGALDLRLAGDAWYGGVLFKKDFIGDEIKEINYHDIRRANRLMTCTGVLSFLIAMVFRALVLILS